jgi:large subunit ribosomal protein L24
MEREAPIQVSNLMLYCSECGKGVRVRKKILEDGSKIRVCSKCEADLEKQK